MCGKRLRKFLVLSVLFFLFFFSPSCFPCYAEVILTDKEAQEMLNEMQKSKMDLSSLQTQLEDVKSTYNEQKASYEMQLTKANQKKENLKTAVTVTSTSTVIFAVLMVLFIFI